MIHPRRSVEKAMLEHPTKELVARELRPVICEHDPGKLEWRVPHELFEGDNCCGAASNFRQVDSCVGGKRINDDTATQVSFRLVERPSDHTESLKVRVHEAPRTERHNATLASNCQGLHDFNLIAREAETRVEVSEACFSEDRLSVPRRNPQPFRPFLRVEMRLGTDAFEYNCATILSLLMISVSVNRSPAISLSVLDRTPRVVADGVHPMSLPEGETSDVENVLRTVLRLRDWDIHFAPLPLDSYLLTPDS
jgi:hypothetical protein